jgi:hypothetical protein
VKFLCILLLIFIYLSWLFNVVTVRNLVYFSPSSVQFFGWVSIHILSTFYPIAQLLAYQYEQHQQLQKQSTVSLGYTLLAIHNYPTVHLRFPLFFRTPPSVPAVSRTDDYFSLSITYILLPAYGSLIGSWVGGFAIPLDWDVPWKYWPVCNIYGFVGGLLLGEMMTIFALTRTVNNNISSVFLLE